MEFLIFIFCFFILSIIVFFLYYLKRNKQESFELSSLFQSKTHFLVMNLAIILSCCCMNTLMQFFCIPVMWAAVLLLCFLISFLCFPFIDRNSRLFILVPFSCGLGFFISIYIILFGRQEYLSFITINLPIFLVLALVIRAFKKITRQNYFNALWFYTAFILAPYFIILQLILLLKSVQSKAQKTLFISSSILFLFICLALTYQINKIIKTADNSKNIETDLRALNKNPVNNYLTELILGAHWKYHTEFCIYDGARPPFHDPVLVVANKILFPYTLFANGTKLEPTYNKTWLDLYKKLYPDNPLAFNCRCAMSQQ